MMVNDHTRSAENWKCVWYLLRLNIYRVYVDSHSLGQLALASKRTASIYRYRYIYLFIYMYCAFLCMYACGVHLCQCAYYCVCVCVCVKPCFVRVSDM